MPEKKLFQFLQQIVADKALESSNHSGQITLKEPGIMEVEVSNFPVDAVAIRSDKLGSLSGLNNGDWKKACDYMLIYNTNGQDIAIFVELKRTLKDTGGMEQLRWSLPLLDYLHSIYRVNSSRKLKSKFSIRYWLIAQKNTMRLDKQPVRPRLVSKYEHKDIKVNTCLKSRVCFSEMCNS